MKKITPQQLSDNFFEAIGKEWMLVSAGTIDNFNMMTASWGCIGWLWNKPVAIIFVRPERYTHDFIENCEKLTLSFLGDEGEMRKVYNFCGSKSGRDINKAQETGLTPVETKGGSVAFKEARLTLECRKLYSDTIKPNAFIDANLSQWYGEGKGGYHDFYVVEIMNVYEK